MMDKKTKKIIADQRAGNNANIKREMNRLSNNPKGKLGSDEYNREVQKYRDNLPKRVVDDFDKDIIKANKERKKNR